MSHIETAFGHRTAFPRAMEASESVGSRGDDPPHPAGNAETYNPWTIVNIVFEHLAGQGLHPVLGETGDPGKPAADLLRAFGIKPDKEGSRQASEQTKRQLAEIRALFDEDPLGGAAGDNVSHVESP